MLSSLAAPFRPINIWPSLPRLRQTGNRLAAVLLLERHANAAAVDTLEKTCTMWAAYLGHLDILHLLEVRPAPREGRGGRLLFDRPVDRLGR